MTTEQTEFSYEELLLSHDYAEPLVANGVRCHGGFDADFAERGASFRIEFPLGQ